MATLIFIISLLSPVIHSKFFLAAPLYYMYYNYMEHLLQIYCSPVQYINTCPWLYCELIYWFTTIALWKGHKARKNSNYGMTQQQAIPWLAKNMRSRFRTPQGFCFEPLNFRVILREINWLPLSSFWTFLVLPTYLHDIKF